MNIAIGIDVGGTNLNFGVFTQSGQLIKKSIRSTNITSGGKTILINVADEIKSIQNELAVSRHRILGVGIGMPGPVLDNGYVESCVNLNLKDMNSTVTLSELLNGIPVVTGNDANVAALGEMWKGGGEGYQSLLFVTLGTGVGSGVVFKQRIVYGSKGLAGEIGHIVVNPHEVEVCNCGKRGCLDQMASATGIVRNAKRFLEFTDAESGLRSLPQLTAKEIVDFAKQGDVLAYIIVDYCMSFLGKCLADVSYVIDPQVFVIGGGVSKAGEFLTKMIERHYEKYASLKKEKTPVVVAKLGEDAGIYGAAKMIIDAQRKE